MMTPNNSESIIDRTPDAAQGPAPALTPIYATQRDSDRLRLVEVLEADMLAVDRAADAITSVAAKLAEKITVWQATPKGLATSSLNRAAVMGQIGEMRHLMSEVYDAMRRVDGYAASLNAFEQAA